MTDEDQNQSETPTIPEPETPRQGVGGTKVIQPTEAIMQEVRAAEAAKAAEPPAPPSLPPAQSPQNPPYQSLTTEPKAAADQSVAIAADALLKDSPQQLHFGIYIIVGFLVLSFILGFFNNNSHILYSILLFTNLLLAIGILFKKENARKVLVFFSSLFIVLEILVIIGLFAVQAGAQRRANNAQTALNNVSANNARLTQAQATDVANLKQEIATQQADLHKTYAIAYIEDGIIVAANLGLVIYLTRPGVKAIFH